MKVKRNQLVVVVDNETGVETQGRIVEYTPDKITLNISISFNAKNVHFKKR